MFAPATALYEPKTHCLVDPSFVKYFCNLFKLAALRVIQRPDCIGPPLAESSRRCIVEPEKLLQRRVLFLCFLPCQRT